MLALLEIGKILFGCGIGWVWGKKLDKWMCFGEERDFLVFYVGDNL